MTIEWLSTNITAPEPGREIIAKNPLKPISFRSSVKQSKIMKFHPSFSEDQIVSIMIDDNLTLWSYTE